MTFADPGNPGSATDPSRWVDQYGDALYRYALFRVRHPEQAEELVQETFLAALKSRDRFAGQSSEQTWLMAILRRKIVDLYRLQERQGEDVPLGEHVDKMFDCNGHWAKAPANWPDDPTAAMVQQEFWNVFEDCVGRLPAAMGQTFLMREIEEISTEELCDLLEISPTNLWTRLHRARLLLRKCLEDRWFNN